MKNYLFVMGLFIIGCELKSRPSVEKVELRKVDFGITSIFSVHCDSFEDYFHNELETFVICEVHEIGEIIEAIKDLEKDTMMYQPDVRAKLLLYYNNSKVDTVCLSNIGLILNGDSFKTSSALVKIIERY